MKYTHKKLPDSVIELEATLSHQDFLNYWQPAYDKALSSVQLKGFRPGTAPKDLAGQAVDKEKVFEEAATNAVRATLREVSLENDWQLIDQPKVEIMDSQSPTDADFKFKAICTVFPKINLADYKKIANKINSQTPKEITVDEKEVAKTIDWVRNSRAKLTRVNREAKLGDVADVDFSGFLDGKSLDGASGKADRFVLGEGKFIPGFEEQIVGHKEKNNFEFSVPFPKDYWKENLRDKKVDFKVAVQGVFERELPELTDEFVKGLGAFETVAAFTQSVRDGIKKEKTEKEREKTRLRTIEEIIKQSKIELPKVMVERTLDSMVAKYTPFLKDAKAGEAEEMRKNLAEKARQSVASHLVLYQISHDEKLDPTKEEVEAEANQILQHSQFSKDPNVDPKKIYDYSYGIVQNKKVLDFLEGLK